eukprot:13961796-Alexandrium_andersonii.AAC.1
MARSSVLRAACCGRCPWRPLSLLSAVCMAERASAAHACARVSARSNAKAGALGLTRARQGGWQPAAS